MFFQEPTQINEETTSGYPSELIKHNEKLCQCCVFKKIVFCQNTNVRVSDGRIKQRFLGGLEI